MARTARTARGAPSPHRKPAGKHPALRPMTSKSAAKAPAARPSKRSKMLRENSPILRPKDDPQARATKTRTARYKQQQQQTLTTKRQRSKAATTQAQAKSSRAPHPWQTATRRVFTRSQNKVFRLLVLPPELRNVIYQHAAAVFSSRRKLIDLEDLTIPERLSLSRQMRSEALPFFFSSNHFKLRVKSNYCVFRRHFHTRKHLRYGETGKMALPALLKRVLDHGNTNRLLTATNNEPLKLNEESVRFKHVTFQVDCVCCDPGKQIARLELGMKGAQPEVDCTFTVRPREHYEETKASVGLIFDEVRSAVAEMRRRDGFNGFKIADLVAVAACASYDEKGEGKGCHDV